MRSVICLLIVIVFVLGVAYAQAGDPRLRLCIDEWPPYEYTENDQPKGISYTTVMSVLSRMGSETPQIVLATWGRCVERVRTGKSHAAFTALKTKERQKFALYPAESLVESYWVFFIREDRSGSLRFRTLSDLDGRSIGIVKGFYYPPDFLRYAKNHAKLEYGPNSMTNFRKLLDNRLDYIFEDLAVGIYGVRAFLAQGEVVPLVDTVMATEPMYIMFSKKAVSPDFVARFSAELERYKKTDQYKKMLQEYLPWFELTSQKEKPVSREE